MLFQDGIDLDQASRRIDKVDWGDVVKDRPVRLVIPHIVLDELDDKGTSAATRSARRRAARSPPLDEVREQLEGQGYAKLPVGEATVEYLVDEEGHTRRDNPDSVSCSSPCP